ncbi:uncharacterized protein Z519_01804 [Cladophialophora bantiana CBS 173.52]|uniref:Uncharacterized protein n=1 Tax=Cladophialophora bantiana (strain ATCC 10958 / CBS 173.52 / CDC B-1940 / NIH 8579) TaxID=1442370 RepID=A0A0D2I4L6_CLAB1|nr:uncharacterized protein Z519_01804 [Cladophialophora bantiana CBS 173.52]KIW98220.1 hypothetical protein Z519_01804 [Cladophialophora bantiana CBS 173.52]
MAIPSLGEACSRLADALEQHWSNDQVLNRKHSALISALRSSSDLEDEKCGVLTLMPALVGHVDEVIQIGQPEEFKTAVLCTLADSTREGPSWRLLFGLEAKPNSAVNDNEIRRACPPDCILEIARRIVSATTQASTTEQLRSALRIIANCCADNNINRNVIIQRDGIEAMLEMVRQGRECDLVIPTLYNVCVDYDEPAKNAAGEPWVSLQEKTADGAEAGSGPPVNTAEQRLGTFWFPPERLTSFQILLEAKDYRDSPIATVADLVEMASRVALYGTQNFVHKVGGHGLDDLVEVDTIADVVRSLLTYGVELAKEDFDCRVSICQAILNVLSQPDTHYIVGGDFRMIWNLIHLPYTMNALEIEIEADEDERALATYRKEILKTIYSVSATGAYEKISGSQSPLIRNCIDALEVDRPHDLLASICVLLANSVVSKERAQQLIQSSPRNVANSLSGLITKTPGSAVLLPAISLATRLSLCPDGQDAFHQTNMISAISLLLTSPTSQVDSSKLKIQCDTISLVRLMIKGRMEYIHDLAFDSEASSHANIMHMMISIFETTSQTETKTEIGRLSIEILRTLLSSTRQSTQSVIEAEQDEEGCMDHKKAESIFQSIIPSQTRPSPSTTSPPNLASRTTIADTISYILTQSISQPSNTGQQSSHQSHLLPAEAEAWFGLALLSTFPSTHGSIKAALARHNFHLLKRLRKITATKDTTALDSVGPHNLAKRNDGINIEEVAGIRNAPGTVKTATEKLDPRYENIKVLVARLVQPQQSQPQLQLQSLCLDSESPGPTAAQAGTEADKQVQEGLEAAAAEMGLSTGCWFDGSLVSK